MGLDGRGRVILRSTIAGLSIYAGLDSRYCPADRVGPNGWVYLEFT